MPASQSPRVAVLVAVLLALGGVGLITSGVVMVFAGAEPPAGGTTLAIATTAPTTLAVTTAAAAATVTAAVPPATEFVTLTDDTGTITYEAPATWVDVERGAWTSDGADIGPSLSAAVDLTAWLEGWETPGMFVGVTDRFGAAEALGDFEGSCDFDRTAAIAAGGFAGTGEWWWWCGDGAASFFVGVVELGADRIALFQILDRPALLPVVVDHVLGSFRYTG